LLAAAIRYAIADTLRLAIADKARLRDGHVALKAAVAAVTLRLRCFRDAITLLEMP